jgi:hypothetical protein
MIPLIYAFFLVVSTKLKVSHDNNKFEEKKTRRNRKIVLCPSRYNKEMAAIAAAKAEEIRKQEEFYANQGYMELSLKSARKIQRIWRGYLVRRIWRKVLKKLKKKRLKEAKKNKKNKKK